MDSTDPAAAIFSVDLGSVSAFDQHIFPLAYYDGGDDFTKGSILIRATLQEMNAIKQLGIDLNKNEDFVFNTRLKLEALKVKKGKLQDNRKTLNPFKAFLNYRAARLFHAASKALYLQTKRTSEKIHREEGCVRVVPASRLRTADGPIPPDTKVVAVVVDLPEGWDSNAVQTMHDAVETIATTDPFQNDSMISQLGDDEHAVTLADTESLLSQDEPGSAADEYSQAPATSGDPQGSWPISPQTITHIHVYHNSVVTTNSNVTGLTVNRDSQNSSGASVTQQLTP